MFESILIANRGEIALRIMQTAKKMGIRTIAIYSEADTNALHVKYADDAVYVGPSPSTESYLKLENVMAAIDESGAAAVHPGYGFMSEKDYFAEAVMDKGVAWVGPPPDAITKMGDKITSKKIASAAGVNTVPGILDAIEDIETARKVAGEIGYPVMIKAAAGGGGKGMRVARSEDELVDGMRLASSEAQSSFNDGRVFIEKFLDNPRHIEIQILADTHGNVISLGERECSIQRRHQKVIEEAPSMFLSPEKRAEMEAQSVALAKEVGYVSAGTVEFIVDDKGEFYFLEMNTRLQVEHRVTELITGIDLVEQMIRIAAGEELSIKQSDVKLNGWAFESRIYAEDPARGFLPSIGRITEYFEPKVDGTLVIDSGIAEGREVSMFYDPMIAKVSTHAATRDESIALQLDALAQYSIQGVAHNMGFLQAVYKHDRFQKGDISTNFIEQEYPKGFSGAELDTAAKQVCASVATFAYMRDSERAGQTSGQLRGYNHAMGQRWIVTLGKESFPVYVRKRDYGYDVSFGDELLVVRSSWKLGRGLFQGTVNGQPVSVRIKPLPEGYLIGYSGANIKVTVRSTRVADLAKYMPDTVQGSDAMKVNAPIAGLVSSVKVKAGERVTPGQELFVIEAMKMENIIYAEHDAVIKKVAVEAPQSVNADALVIEFEKPAA